MEISKTPMTPKYKTIPRCNSLSQARIGIYEKRRTSVLSINVSAQAHNIPLGKELPFLTKTSNTTL